MPTTQRHRDEHRGMIMLSGNFLRQQQKSEMSDTNVVTIAVL